MGTKPWFVTRFLFLNLFQTACMKYAAIHCHDYFVTQFQSQVTIIVEEQEGTIFLSAILP